MDVDHIQDMQLGGAARDIANMSLLDSSVNRSLGAQIAAHMKEYPIGTAVAAVSIFASSVAKAASSITPEQIRDTTVDLTIWGGNAGCVYDQGTRRM